MNERKVISFPKADRWESFIGAFELVLDALADKIASRVVSGIRATVGCGTISPRLLTLDEAAIYLGRTKEAIQHMVASGKLPTVRSDRRVFIDMQDIDRWIEGAKQNAA